MSPVGPPGAPWHFLYFLPDPQGQSALRPTAPTSSCAVATEEDDTSTSPVGVGEE